MLELLKSHKVKVVVAAVVAVLVAADEFTDNAILDAALETAKFLLGL